jgi:hypothetical protein
MTPDDPLERELELLHPRPPSPELRQRIGNQIARPWRRPNWVGLAAAAAAAAVAAIAVGLSLWRPVPPGRPPLIPPKSVAVSPPSVLAYNRAIAESPSQLDALLDAQSVRASRAVSPAGAGLVPNLLAFTGSRECFGFPSSP